MYTPAALLDLHRRSQHSLRSLMDQARELPESELDREHEGFGYPTVRLQLHHLIGAQEYWFGVLQGRVEADEDPDAYPTLAELAAFRDRVAAAGEEYLTTTPKETLNRSREFATWGGRTKALRPAHVVLRTITHLYHHLGQIQAICRLAGVRTRFVDFPVEPELDPELD